MAFREKYISKDEETNKGNPDKKVVISDDTFAILEMLDQLAFKLSRKN